MNYYCTCFKHVLHSHSISRTLIQVNQEMESDLHKLQREHLLKIYPRSYCVCSSQMPRIISHHHPIRNTSDQQANKDCPASYQLVHALSLQNHVAKLSDFGLAKLRPKDDQSHVSTRGPKVAELS
ncbi:hypothetical protein SAY87_028129 [Trapa incisa]|uniref:Uncharacterized protein n=1 Tax=Trapa incisa TaxID=236973 RepID=A0AAN7L0C6_9MYRT|nr:hypothetical protein SAY87_028129 [Trapa incisa]